MAIGVTARQQQPGQQVTDAIRVSVPDRGLRQDLRAVNIVWRRELIRFKSDRLRAVTSLVQPVLFLFVLGTGLSSLASHGRTDRLPDVHLPGRAGDVSAVHCHFLGGVHRLGPGVRVLARDARGAGEQVRDRHREMPRRRDSSHLPGNRLFSRSLDWRMYPTILFCSSSSSVSCCCCRSP